jgi:competence CoiA-like predicted nuclease
MTTTTVSLSASQEPLFEYVENDYYDEQNSKQSNSDDYEVGSRSCFLINSNRKCNFYRNVSSSFVLSTDYRLGKKMNLKNTAANKKENKFEALHFIENSYLNLTIEYNYKLDFKVSVFLAFCLSFRRRLIESWSELIGL